MLYIFFANKQTNFFSWKGRGEKTPYKSEMCGSRIKGKDPTSCHVSKRWHTSGRFPCFLSGISLCANPLARSPGQVKLDSDKWKLWN